MGTKNNPGEFDCYQAAEPDEPYFMLLARDPLAPILVGLWASIRATHGCPDHGSHNHSAKGELGKSKVEEAMGVAQSMIKWRKEKKGG